MYDVKHDMRHKARLVAPMDKDDNPELDQSKLLDEGRHQGLPVHDWSKAMGGHGTNINI